MSSQLSTEATSPGFHKKGMKQGNLFSFFSKKTGAAQPPSNLAASSSSPPPLPTQSTTSSFTHDFATRRNSSGKSARNSDSKEKRSSLSRATTKKEAVSPAPIDNSEKPGTRICQTIKIGDRISVFWPDDNQYYDATVTENGKRSSADSGGSVFVVTYDDGEVEKLDLSQVPFSRLDSNACSTDEKQTRPLRRKQISAENYESKKRRRIVDDESEDSDDYIELADDDGSDYEETMESSNNDQEEATWMDSEDDEDELVREKKKLQRSRKNSKPSRKVVKVSMHSSSSRKKKSRKEASEETKSPDLSTFTSPHAGVSSKDGMTASTPASNMNSRPKTVSPMSTSPSTVTHGFNKSSVSGGGPSAQAIPYQEGVVNPAGSHVHNHLAFLRHPRDANGRTPEDSDYDPRTLRVDYRELERHLKKLSPGVKQWWALKAQYFDTVLLFKTGKFYEMFHMDADVGVNFLAFTYMKGHVAHAGFPEVSYGNFAEKLVQAGYKVARVEQTETPEQLKERKKQKGRSGPAPQVVNREVCSIMTLGTRTFCFMDAESGLEASDSDSSIGPLLAIREVLLDATTCAKASEGDEGGAIDEVLPVCEYGVAIVDAVRATITVGQFADDVLRNRMKTLLAKFQPAEILIEGGEAGASTTLQSLLRCFQANCPYASARIERIQKAENFPTSTALDSEIRRKLQRNAIVHPWDVEETLHEVHRRGYYPRGSRGVEESRSTTRWPKVLHMCVEGGANLALSSFGAALFYLQRNLVDQEILGMGIVRAYVPPSTSGVLEGPSGETKEIAMQEEEMGSEGVSSMRPPSPASEPAPPIGRATDTIPVSSKEAEITHLALDGTTLHNLEILANAKTNTSTGSLWSKINNTKTPHGTRMLRAWLLRPLFRKAEIDRRAKAVEELLSGSSALALSDARSILVKCGDIERLLSRVHSMGEASASGDGDIHPNSRAILYEGGRYTKRKVGDFSKLLNGLRVATEIPEIFAGIEIQSGLLRKVVRRVSDGGYFPEITDELNWFFDNFDCEKASRGEFEPNRGVDEQFDLACDAVHRIEEELIEYKNDSCSRVLDPSARSKWKYTNINPEARDKYLIELPADVRVPSDFVLKGKRGSGKKQINKYRTATVEQLVQDLENALAMQKEGKARGMQVVFSKFDANRSLWAAVARCTALLDALGSLAQTSGKPGYCRPTILECPPSSRPCIHIVQGQHPCVDVTHSGGEFIPNDLTLGSRCDKGVDTARVLLLSGPNMGGKSTLLRQTCLIAILAQIGCFVPAQECALTPVDRIFTRLGASDRLLQGQSTFFVELAETAGALRGATRRSLVIFDELGRGTSTFDGTAIASACVQHLIEKNECLTMFATHYHSLLEEWQKDSSVRVGHMQCHVEGGVCDASNSKESGQEEHNITFLYTLGEGACPKSFGIHVAKLAGLPTEVLQLARARSTAFENELNQDNHGTVSNALSLRSKIKDLVEEGDGDQLSLTWEELEK